MNWSAGVECQEVRRPADKPRESSDVCWSKVAHSTAQIRRTETRSIQVEQTGQSELTEGLGDGGSDKKAREREREEGGRRKDR